jgi:thioredoxin reductase
MAADGSLTDLIPVVRPGNGNIDCAHRDTLGKLSGMEEFDVVVIGGGAAGLSAALVVSRARRSVLVVDAGAPRNAPAAHMHGFLSRDGLPPAELLAVGRAEVSGYGGQIVFATVAEVLPGEGSGFAVRLSEGGRVSARRLVIATGLRDELPAIPGLAERWARDVLHCPYCHGYEVRDRRLAVIGWTREALGYAQIVRQWSADLLLVIPPDAVSAGDRMRLEARGVVIVEGAVTRVVVEDDQLSGVEIDGGRVIARDAVFVPPRFVPNNDLLVSLGCEVDEGGWPVVADRSGRTSIAGVWVAGNVANPRAQVITAAGEGSAAAIAINADLVEEDVRLAASDAEHRKQDEHQGGRGEQAVAGHDRHREMPLGGSVGDHGGGRRAGG